MYSTYRQHNANARWARRVLGAAAIVCVSIPVYASDPPYNPNHVDNAQVLRLGEICESVMGLRPSETLTDNLWPGNPDEGSRTNEYRGCIASLSSSLQANATERAEKRAQEHCRADGLEAGSPELAVCILSVAEAPPASNRILLAGTGHPDVIGQVRESQHRSLFSSTTLQRERLACAEIGLEPNEGAFTTCVEGLTRVMSARLMNEFYRN